MFGVFKRINWSKLPSIVWVFVILGGLFAFIASIIGLFWALANIEGFGSLIFFLIGYKFIRGTGNNVGDAIIILFFALMGVAVDQPGNWLYNKPLEFWQCTDGTHLVRGVIVTHPLPGRTDVSQDFTCVDDQEN